MRRKAKPRPAKTPAARNRGESRGKWATAFFPVSKWGGRGQLRPLSEITCAHRARGRAAAYIRKPDASLARLPRRISLATIRGALARRAKTNRALYKIQEFPYTRRFRVFSSRHYSGRRRRRRERSVEPIFSLRHRQKISKDSLKNVPPQALPGRKKKLAANQQVVRLLTRRFRDSFFILRR